MRGLIGCLFAILAVITMVASPAAAQDAADDASTLPNTSWVLKDLTGDATESVPFTVTFIDEQTFLVGTNCEVAGGSYTLGSTGVITQFDVVDSTYTNCEDETSLAFIEQLQLTTAYSVGSTGGLVLTLSDGTHLMFDPALAGITWEWTGFLGSDDTELVPTETDVFHVTFNGDGTVDLETPCASGSGAWTLTDGVLDIDLSAIDASSCPADSANAQVVADLDMATSYLIAEGNLVVVLPMDAGTHQFSPVSPVSATPEA